MLCFFFQAEDGIRDIGVTGVQTCALPISIEIVDTHLPGNAAVDGQLAANDPDTGATLTYTLDGGAADGTLAGFDVSKATAYRSEERRVGKEGRSRWSPDH